MPLTGRNESDAPLKLVEKLLPIPRTRGSARRVLTYIAHFGIGAMWSGGHGVIEWATGARGQRAVATVFGSLYAGDLALNTALGLYKPWRWSLEDWIVDVGDKLVLAEATTFAYERLAPDRR